MGFYFVERMGVYGRGVYWIGTDKDAAIEKAKALAMADVDDYHYWEVKRFVEPVEASEEADHERIFGTSKVIESGQ